MPNRALLSCSAVRFGTQALYSAHHIEFRGSVKTCGLVYRTVAALQAVIQPTLHCGLNRPAR